jgi:hypothetical protein
MTAISHESYRCSYHPRRYGGLDTDPLAGSMLPGSKCPRLEWMELPEKTRPMAEVVRDASEFARQFMRTGKSSSTVEATAAPVPATNGVDSPPQRTEAERKLGELLRRQAQLADDPSADEGEYQNVIAEIARTQTAIDAARKVAQQHG